MAVFLLPMEHLHATYAIVQETRVSMQLNS